MTPLGVNGRDLSGLDATGQDESGQTENADLECKITTDSVPPQGRILLFRIR
jgi:hypothetical protein